jgi:hypothetical protein
MCGHIDLRGHTQVAIHPSDTVGFTHLGAAESLATPMPPTPIPNRNCRVSSAPAVGPGRARSRSSGPARLLLLMVLVVTLSQRRACVLICRFDAS